jgi:hypothetical protein
VRAAGLRGGRKERGALGRGKEGRALAACWAEVWAMGKKGRWAIWAGARVGLGWLFSFSCFPSFSISFPFPFLIQTKLNLFEFKFEFEIKPHSIK